MSKADQTHRGRWAKGKCFDAAILTQAQIKVLKNNGTSYMLPLEEAKALVEARAATVLSAWTVKELINGKYYQGR